MKKLLSLLFSIFFLSSTSVYADDISDFQIEGISIGDSLLDYMTEDEILKEIEKTKDIYFWLNEPNKYVAIYLQKNFPTYDDGLFVIIKNNQTSKYITNKNEKYIILYIAGGIIYTEEFDSCIQKRDEIVGEFSKMFPNTDKWEKVGKSKQDPSGNSIIDAVYFEFESGSEIDAYCRNFEETFRIKKNWTEGLNISISTKEVASWLRDYK